MKRYIALIDLKDITLPQLIDDLEKVKISVVKVYSKLGLLLLATNKDIDDSVHKNILNMELAGAVFTINEEE